jgi:hypothetical protein
MFLIVEKGPECLLVQLSAQNPGGVTRSPVGALDKISKQHGRYSRKLASGSELEGGRGKGKNDTPRTRLGYPRVSIACGTTKVIALTSSILSTTKDPLSATAGRQ